jgi:hypothetical protein
VSVGNRKVSQHKPANSIGAQNSRQEGRPEDEVAEQEAIESVKSYADDHAEG